jgi:hypothetical protein
MSNLPKLKTPTYFLTIPSTKKKVKYRPFLVQEEKILLLIKESEDEKEMVNCMKDIISACTYGKVDVSKLALFDIEYMFLQLRAKSIGETIEIPMKCKNEIEELVVNEEGINEKKTKVCGNVINFVIDLTKVKVKFPINHTKDIIIEDDIGVSFRYPDIDDTINSDMIKENPIEYIASLITSIFDKDNIYDASVVKKEDMVNWLNQLTRKQFEKIQKNFFDSMPSIKHTIKYKCDKCGKSGEYTFEGVSDFF